MASISGLSDSSQVFEMRVVSAVGVVNRTGTFVNLSARAISSYNCAIRRIVGRQSH